MVNRRDEFSYSPFTIYHLPFTLLPSIISRIMWNKPGREAFTRREWKLIEAHRTPREVQRYLRTVPYNWELEGGTLRSFREVVRRNTAHCLEAALAAAVMLEQHD